MLTLKMLIKTIRHFNCCHWGNTDFHSIFIIYFIIINYIIFTF